MGLFTPAQEDQGKGDVCAPWRLSRVPDPVSALHGLKQTKGGGKKQSHCSNDAPDYYNKTLTEGTLEQPLRKTVWRAPHTRDRAATGPSNPAPEHTPR